MKLTPIQEKILDESLHALNLPVRIINALETSAGIYSVRDLLQMKPQEILSLPNFGKATLNAVYSALSKYGFNREGQKPVKENDRESELRRKRIRDALGGPAVDDWDTEILFKQARSRQKRGRTPKPRD